MIPNINITAIFAIAVMLILKNLFEQLQQQRASSGKPV